MRIHLLLDHGSITVEDRFDNETSKMRGASLGLASFTP